MPLDLDRSVTVMGGFRWVELQLFELLGRFATSVVEPETKLMLGVHAHHHAWHAELWRERVPVLRGVDVDAVTMPPDPALTSVFVLLSESAATGERLSGVYRAVLPRLITAYSSLLEGLDPRTDGPSARALSLMLRDDHDHWLAGEREIQRLLRSGDEVARAAAHQAKVESALVDAGGFTPAPGRAPV